MHWIKWHQIKCMHYTISLVFKKQKKDDSVQGWVYMEEEKQINETFKSGASSPKGLVSGKVASVGSLDAGGKYG